MTRPQTITWGLRIFFLAVAALLLVQGEVLLALLPLLVATGIEWRAGDTSR